MQMKPEYSHDNRIPYAISYSTTTTEVNKTGTWRTLRPYYDEKTAPCSGACPVGADIPHIEMLVDQGKFQEAWETIMAENPFPAVCGSVCFHPCESFCNRAEFDTAVAIQHLERFLGEAAITAGYPAPDPAAASQGKQVAIIGAGPAGLAAAYFLRRLGYACEIFESEPEPGGLLRWGIPQYRLAQEILQHEIARIINLGVSIHCGQRINRTFMEEASKKYDALFIGCGLSRSLNLNIPGQALATDGLAFLHGMRAGQQVNVAGTAAIIGGGNTAVDVARTLLRLGVTPVILYRRRQADMPAFLQEINRAQEEGVEIRELLVPIEIKKESKDYVIAFQKMKIEGKDADGRAQPIPDGEKTQTIKVGHLFTALGAGIAEDWHDPRSQNAEMLALGYCTVSKGDTLRAFGGDTVNQTKSVADAIASGKQAAMALDTYFKKGWDEIVSAVDDCKVGSGPAGSMEIFAGGTRRSRNSQVVGFKDLNTDYFQTSARIFPAMQIPAQRTQTFTKSEATLSADEARKEAGRCFNCGICSACGNCRLFCPEVACFEEDKREINLDYCKGCGICIVECPRNAMNLGEEKP